MTQREFIDGAMKILGFIVLLAGLIMSSSSLLKTVIYYHAVTTKAHTSLELPEEMLNNLTWEDKQEMSIGVNKMRAYSSLGSLIRWLIVAIFGLAMIKKTNLFVDFLQVKDTAVQHAPPAGRGEAPRP
jgi:hypothetical protein